MADSEWTHVRKGRKSRTHHAPAPSPRDPSDIKPLSALQADLTKFQSQYDTSPIRKLIQSHKSSCTTITKAVCLGIGTFDPPDGSYDAKRRTYIQYLAFLTMVDEIESLTGSTISVLFQEPLFTSSDKDLIALRQHHQVVHSPQATDAIDSNTLLFAVHLYRPIYVEALKSHVPAAFVGTGWDIWDGVVLKNTDDLANMKIMEDTYTKYAFPQDQDSTAFSTTSLYIRPAETNHDTEASEKAESKPGYKVTSEPINTSHVKPENDTKSESNDKVSKNSNDAKETETKDKDNKNTDKDKGAKDGPTKVT